MFCLKKKIFFVSVFLIFFLVASSSYVTATFSPTLSTYYQDVTPANSIEGARGMQVDTTRKIAYISATTDDSLTAINFSNPDSLSVYGSLADSAPPGSLDGIWFGYLDAQNNIFYAPAYTDDTSTQLNVTLSTFTELNSTAADSAGAGSKDGIYDNIKVATSAGVYSVTSSYLDAYVISHNVTNLRTVPAVLSSYTDTSGACSVGVSTSGAAKLYNIPGTSKVIVAATGTDYVTVLNVSLVGVISCLGSGYTDSADAGSINGLTDFYYDTATDYLYVPATTDGYLTILTNVASGTPTLVGSVGGMTTPISVSNVYTDSDSQKYVFVGSSTAAQNITIINVTDPANPAILSVFSETSGTCVYNGVYSLFVDGDYLFASSGVDGCFYSISLYSAPDTTYPLFSNYNITYITPANNTAYSSGANYQFNSTIINTNGTVGLQFNSVNYTASNLSSVFNASITNLAAGTYSYYWWGFGNGTDKNFNLTSLMSYTVAKATPTLTFRANGGTSNLSLIYPQQVNISASTVAGTGTVGLDKDNVNYLSSNGLNVTLSAGSYIFRANITGNQNYSDVGYSYYNITINKTIPQGSLTNTTSWTITYPTQTNISYSETNTGDGDVAYNVSRNNVYKNGGENVTLGVGTYNYVLNTTGGTNYTSNSSMDAKTLTVQQNNTYVLSLSILPSVTETYPTQINATGTNCPSELTCNLYNNQTGALTNSANYTFGAGVYNITYNTTGNTNYSAKSVSQILTINKAILTGALTNTTSLTVTYPLAINVSYTETNTGDGDVTYKIYRDNVDVTTDKGLNVTLSAGTYNYILNSTGGANYSTNASISNFTITVNQATPVITKLLNSGTSNITITYPQQVNATGSSAGGTIKIFRDSTDVTSENGLNISLSAGGYVYKFNVTGNTNYSSVAGEYMQVNISKATSSVNLTLNNSESNITIIQGIAIDLNCSTLTGNSGDTLTLYRQGSVINSGISPIGNTTTFNTVQVENITCIYSDSQNYTSSSETWFVYVNAANTCTCAGLNNNWEINMGDYCVISTTCNLGAGNITFTGTGNTTFNAAISFKNLQYPSTGQTLFIGSNAIITVG